MLSYEDEQKEYWNNYTRNSSQGAYVTGQIEELTPEYNSSTILTVGKMFTLFGHLMW